MISFGYVKKNIKNKIMEQNEDYLEDIRKEEESIVERNLYKINGK